MLYPFNISNYELCNIKYQRFTVWKTMPGHVKQVPQDSTEWDRTDMGHRTEKNIYACDIDIDSSSEPSSNKL